MLKLNFIPIALFVIIFITGGLFFNSCKFNYTKLTPHKDGSLYMSQASQSPAKHTIIIKDTTYSFVYGAAYGGPSSPGSDISVHFNVQPALVDSFNARNSTSYKILPKKSYNLSKKSTIIPAHKVSTSPLSLNVKANKITGGGKGYLLPVTMKVINGPIQVNKKLQTTYFLIQGRYVQINRNHWVVHNVDSQQKDKFPITNIIDDDLNTFWNTEYTPIRTGLPHYFSINMKKMHNLHGFKLVGHNYALGQNPKKIKIQFSNDGNTFNNEKDFTLSLNDQVYKTKVLLPDPITARYFKIIVTKNVSSPKTTTIAEVYAF